MPQPLIVDVPTGDGSNTFIHPELDPLFYSWLATAPFMGEVDGGFANSTYLLIQVADGGTA